MDFCKNCSSKLGNGLQSSISTPLPDISDRLRGQGISDKNEITNLLQSIDLDMRTISSEILRLQSSILSLRTKRDQLLKLRENAHSLTAPIRSLPTELMGRIFMILCSSVPSNFSTSRHKRRLCDAPPFALSAVCSRWRDIVHGTSGMWSNLSLNLCPSDKESQNVGPPVEFQLERSRDHSLCLDIEMWLHSDSEQEHRLMYTIAEQSHRWQHITIRTGILTVECYASLASLGSLPCLQSLRIHQTLMGTSADELPNLSLFKNAPRLRVLSLNCCPAKAHRSAAGFPWEQIKELELDAGSQTIFRVVEFCPNLESLLYTNAHHSRIDETEGHRQPSDVVPQNSQSLSSLSISLRGNPKLCGYSMLELLISSLTAPSLTSITIRSENSTTPKGMFEGSWPKAHFTDFLSRSRCNVTILRLESIPISDKDAIALLELLPLLHNLTIIESLPPISNHNHAPNAFPPSANHNTANSSRKAAGKTSSYEPTLSKELFEALHRCGHLGSSRSPDTLIPGLKRLELGARLARFDHSAFISMLVSRWIPEANHISDVGVECLQFVRLDIKGQLFAEEAHRELEYLEHAGLIIEVFEQPMR
ncbi:hypothetical protein BDP27DRAFT_1319379 [Rhodocollybia butyracea]|uniref:F-box domain-containing protein n=1 Tax=Rhodocollybia butyracea TaxID=206335 RepID=A0A9P5Q3U3_9AGAR|nr:hypothetical protein BDP27DRAFT_1319379 [Rhodocollybia butyracea]